MSKLKIVALLAATQLTACSTYQYAKDVKYMAFDEKGGKGQRLGQVEGADCVWSVMGYKLGGQPTLDRAFANIRSQRSSTITDSLGGKSSASDTDISYLEQVTTGDDGFNAGVVGKECLTVKGVAYR